MNGTIVYTVTIGQTVHPFPSIWCGKKFIADLQMWNDICIKKSVNYTTQILIRIHIHTSKRT